MAFPPTPTHVVICEHPYVMEGNKMPMYFSWRDDAYLARIDLPGLCQETVRAWAENNTIYVEGDDAKDDEGFDHESPRKFRGQLPLLDKYTYKTDEMKYVISDGVLKISIPYSKV